MSSVTAQCPKCLEIHGEDSHHVCREIVPPAASPAQSVADYAKEAEQIRDDESISKHVDVEIVCADCGRWRARRGKCMRCGGEAWILASEWAEIVKKAQRRREQKRKARA